jgi:predicted transcriptional regulator
MKQNVPVSEIMSKELITLNLKQSLYEAENLFNRQRGMKVKSLSLNKF